MENNLKDHISYLLNISIRRIKPISGGDISKAYLMETDTERFFCKLNYTSTAHLMFLAEKAGLKAIAQTKTVKTPDVLLCEALKNGALLIIEYIEPKTPIPKDFEALGHHLAALHRHSGAASFGWSKNNFIGSLIQYNTEHKDWTSFYLAERLMPQLRLAVDNGLLGKSEVPSEEKMKAVLSTFFENVSAALLHGDLWGGNFLISNDGVPYLIDPAVYYGHHEVDIAMTRLFGGFHKRFYEAYQEHFPSTDGEKERADIYQLYYLLVHLNLFGRSYYGSVKAIINRFFQ